MAFSSAKLTILVMALIVFISGVQGLGINCRGSAACRKNGALADIKSYVSGIQTGRIYTNGEHIACRGQQNGILGLIDPNGGVCAFLQGTRNGVSGGQIRDLIGQLANHGCNACGSVPITFPGSNDPKDGILTVNFVASTANPCPNGLC